MLTVLALSGAVLSVYLAVERLSAPQAGAEPSVADLAGSIAASHPGLEQIRCAPSGAITACWFSGGIPQAAVIDRRPEDAGRTDPTPVNRWLTSLHRSLFLGEAGRRRGSRRGAMLVLALSGAALITRGMARAPAWPHGATLAFAGASRLHSGSATRSADPAAALRPAEP